MQGKNHNVVLKCRIIYAIGEQNLCRRFFNGIRYIVYYIQNVECRRIKYFSTITDVVYYNIYRYYSNRFFHFRIFGKRIGRLRCQIAGLNTNNTFTKKDRSYKSSSDGSPASEGQNIGVLGCTLRVHFR